MPPLSRWAQIAAAYTPHRLVSDVCLSVASYARVMDILNYNTRLTGYINHSTINSKLDTRSKSINEPTNNFRNIEF